MTRGLLTITAMLVSTEPRQWCGVLLVFLVSCLGCDNHSFRYEVRGKLLRPDSSPAAGQTIALTAAHSATDPFEGADPQGSQTKTAADGTYSVEREGYDEGFPGALELFGLPWGAPPLPGVVLWGTKPAWWDPRKHEWELIAVVPIDEARQKRLFGGRRSVEVPTVLTPPAVDARPPAGLRDPVTRPVSSTGGGVTAPIPDPSLNAFLRTATTPTGDESEKRPVPIRNGSTEPWPLDKSQGWNRSLIDERQPRR